MSTSARKVILREIKKLEADVSILELARALVKNDAGNRLSPFGRAVLDAAKANGVKQAEIAKILDITAGAVSQHYGREL